MIIIFERKLKAEKNLQSRRVFENEVRHEIVFCVVWTKWREIVQRQCSAGRWRSRRNFESAPWHQHQQQQRWQQSRRVVATWPMTAGARASTLNGASRCVSCARRSDSTVRRATTPSTFKPRHQHANKTTAAKINSILDCVNRVQQCLDSLVDRIRAETCYVQHATTNINDKQWYTRQQTHRHTTRTRLRRAFSASVSLTSGSSSSGSISLTCNKSSEMAQQQQ